jgi:cell division cycle 20-like protein 1, cofactor of APC complex
MAANGEDPASAASTSFDRPSTPPAIGAKRVHSSVITSKQRAASEGVDPQAVNVALEGLVEGTRSREKTPSGSPSRKRQRIVGDRYAYFGSCGSTISS